MRDINKKFSVRYFLNLVLMDTEDRRYFKQQEITLWRKGDKLRKPNLQSPAIMAGTQNLQNTTQQYQQQQSAMGEEAEDGQDVEGDGSPEQPRPTVKEDFTRAPPHSQSTEGLDGRGAAEATTDPFDGRIENMTREAGDGQNDNGNEAAE